MNTVLFKRTVSLAVRNLFRNRRRTLVTLLLVMVGCIAMGLARGYFVQTLHGLQEIAIRSGFAGSLGSGHVVLKDGRTLTEEERYVLEFGFDNAEEIIAVAETLPNFDYALPRTQISGLASNGERSITFRGYSVDAKAEAELRRGLKDIADRAESFSLGEELLAMEEVPFGALIGQGMAKALGVAKGDTILLLATTVDGAVNAIDVTIVDLLTTGSEEVDRFFLVTAHETAVNLINSDRIGEISFALQDPSRLEQFRSDLAAKLATVAPDQAFSIAGWEEAGIYYPAVRDLFTFMFGFLEVIIVALVLISSWNVINMTVMERVREIGTLRAVGIRQRSIASMFILEVLILGLFSIVLGFLLQALIVYAVNNAGIVMPPPPGGNQGFILKVRFFTEYHPTIAAAVIVALLASSISVLYSIRRLSITESLEHT